MYIVEISFKGGWDTLVPGENYRPAASHWQTLPHNVVSSTPRLSGIQTHNVPAYDKCKYILKQCLFWNTFLATNNVNNVKKENYQDIFNIFNVKPWVYQDFISEITVHYNP